MLRTDKTHTKSNFTCTNKLEAAQRKRVLIARALRAVNADLEERRARAFCIARARVRSVRD